MYRSRPQWLSRPFNPQYGLTAGRVVVCIFLAALGCTLLRAEESVQIFHDDFKTLNPVWGDSLDDFHIQDERLFVSAVPGKSNGTFVKDMTLTNGEIRSRFKIPSGGKGENAGIMFWGDSNREYYQAYLTSMGKVGIWHVTRTSSQPVIDPQEHPSVHMEDENELKVVLRGSHGTFFVNDQLVCEFLGVTRSDSTKFGLFAENPGKGTFVANFSEFEVKRFKLDSQAVVAELKSRLKSDKPKPPFPAAARLMSSRLIDEFDVPRKNWPTPAENGRMPVKVNANQIGRRTCMGIHWEDAECAVEVVNLDPSTEAGGGFFFWFSDVKNYYFVVLGSHGILSCGRIQEGNYTPFRTMPVATDVFRSGAGATNELKLVTKRNLVTILVNGHEVTRFHGIIPKAPWILGLCGDGGPKGATVEFDNLFVINQGTTAGDSNVAEGNLLVDMFETLECTWNVSEDKGWKVRENKLSAAEGGDNAHPILEYLGATFSDAEIRFKIADLSRSRDALSLAFQVGYRDDSNYTSVYIGGTDIAIVEQFVSGEKTDATVGHVNHFEISAELRATIPEYQYRLGAREPNEVRLIMKGADLTVVVNGSTLATFTGKEPMRGKFRVIGGSGGLQYEISDFRVLELPAAP